MELEVDYYTPPPSTHLAWEEKIERIQCVIEAVKKVVPAFQKIDVNPCPNCSYLDRPDNRPDKIVAPRIIQGRRAGLWMTVACCRLARDLPTVATRDEAITQWNERRINFDILPEIARSKPKATHEKMEQISLQ